MRAAVAVQRAAVAALVLAPLAAGPAWAQNYTHPKEMGLPELRFVRPDPENMRVTMANELVAYITSDDRAPLVTITAFVGAGSGHGEAGEAAVVAAALRRGPASMAPEAFRDALEEMAAEYTVTVRHEETEITLDVPAEDGWRAMELLADVLADPAFGAAGAGGPGRTSQAAGIDFASSIQGAIDALESRLFQGHAFGRVPTPAQMDAARGGGAERFHRTHFVPGNAVLAIAGDFGRVEASTRAKEAFEPWREEERPQATRFAEVTTEAPRRVLQADVAKLQGWVVIGHELPPVPDEDEAALHVMDYVLGAYHLDSRLFRESREKRGLTNDNSSFLQPGVRGPGSYTMRTYGRPEAVRLLVDITFRELDRIRETLPTDDEIFVARGALADGLWATRYSTGLDAARSYALEWLRRGGHEWSAGYPGRIRAVTPEQVREAAQRYLHPDRMIVSVVGPLEQIESADPIESEPQLDGWGPVERVDRGR